MSRYIWQFEPKYSALHEDDDLLWVVPFRIQYILGICGLRFSGKSTAVFHLVEKHRFIHHSLASTLRRLANEAGVSEEDRQGLQDFGDSMRRRHNSPSWLARQTLREIRQYQLSHRASGLPARIVVGGFKRVEELELFRAIPQFQAIGLRSSERYRRAADSGLAAWEMGLAPGTPVAEADIRDKLDNRDRKGRDGTGDGGFGQSVDSVMDALGEDAMIDNSGDKGALYNALDECVHALNMKYRRPRG